MSENSIERINPFLKDKRIKLILHKKNRGYGGSLKTAADNSSKKILAILDPDDKLHETALEVMANAYKEYPEYGFIYSTYWGCDSELKNCNVNEEIGEVIKENKAYFKERISHFKTFLKEAYKKTSGFDINQKRAVDKDIIFKLEEITNFKFIKIPLYYYRCHELGISQSKGQFQARVYGYIAKCKAYKRRLNTNLPNCTLKELNIEYSLITFRKLISFSNSIINYFKVKCFLDKLLKKFPIFKNFLKGKLDSINLNFNS